MRIRYHLDENVSGAVADGLRRRGIDVTMPEACGLLSAPDRGHLDFARGEGRVVVTHDPDFLRLQAQGVEHSGIAFAHSGSRSIGELVRSLTRLFVTKSAEEMHNRVEFL